MIDVSEINAGNGSLTLTTTGGANLVVGNQSFQLTRKAGSHHRISATSSRKAANITSTITGGSLGGAIQARDTAIPSVLSSLDSLASNLENSVNSVNQAGTDLNGAPGGNFFVPPPAGGQGAASQMTRRHHRSRRKSPPASTAAPGTIPISPPCSMCRTQAIVQRANAAECLFEPGLPDRQQVSTAQSEVAGSQALIQQIQNQIGSISGVSINEEAANLIQFQQAYQAAAQVASVINTLTATAINLGHSSRSDRLMSSRQSKYSAGPARLHRAVAAKPADRHPADVHRPQRQQPFGQSCGCGCACGQQRANRAQIDQFLTNISDAQGKLQAADSALNNAVQVLTTAITVGTEGANGTMSTSDRQALAQQVQGLQQQMLGLANTSYQGVYVFAGTNVTSPPFAQDQSSRFRRSVSTEIPASPACKSAKVSRCRPTLPASSFF